MFKKKYIGEEAEEDELSIYSKGVRESMLDDDELTPFEEAFMNGYEESA